jgi:hypothetical protein
MLIIVLFAAAALLVSVWFVVTQPTGRVTASKPVPPASAAALERHVRMLSETFHPRDCTHPGNLDRAAAYIRQEFVRARGSVSEQEFAIPENFRFPPGFPEEPFGRCRNHSYRNIIATFGPATEERIIIGAHYDSFGEMPGADDNASGVAGLLELARLIGTRQLPMRVDLVAFTLEEPPFFRKHPDEALGFAGSAVHARSLREKGVRVRFMISLEMIGYFKESEGSQKYPSPLMKLFYPSRGDFAVVVGKLDGGSIVRRTKRAMRSASALPVYSFNAPKSIEGIDWSDHVSYWNVGYPAVMISDTAIYRNSNYHTADDTPETLDYQRMGRVVQGVYAVIAGEKP